MFNISNVLYMVWLLPLVAIIGLIISNRSNYYVERISTFCSSVNLIMSIYIWQKFKENYQFKDLIVLEPLDFYYFINQKDFPSEEGFYFKIGIDGLSISLVILTSFLFFFCNVAALNTNIKNLKFFYILFFLLQFFVLSSFIVLDYLIFYILFEAILIPMFLMIGIWGSRERRIKAANYFLYYAFFGSLFMLFGIFLIYYITGTTSWIFISSYNFDRSSQLLLWFLFFIGFAVKVPLWPFHVWLPEAHVEAPTIGSMLLAGVLLKLGGYGFLRFVLPVFPEASVYYMPFVMTLCFISVLYSSLATMRQVDFKKIIAYSSVAHMSISMLGIFSLNYYGIAGGILLMLAHGLISSVLFYLIGILYDTYQTRFIKYFGGLAQVSPMFATFFCIFSFANAGLPGLALFPAEFLILVGVYSVNTLIGVCVTLTSVLTIVYTFMLFNRTCFGTLKTNIKEKIGNKFKDIDFKSFFLLSISTLSLIYFGFYPDILLKTFSYIVLYISKGSKN